ncbi:hypothetical protein GSI_11711 [Ganoderma sinense ZZ0214-1]|uniref:Uncharacterized protein n=1 Tax=Ganoderma sinense ZZ0214-1 TaxID=1077348 RepID=A0A2G8RWU0_9APHY|nr:hypothetical protein GSI_11711 [Ganoderma sinense ZZ0214-1]
MLAWVGCEAMQEVGHGRDGLLASAPPDGVAWRIKSPQLRPVHRQHLPRNPQRDRPSSLAPPERSDRPLPICHQKRLESLGSLLSAHHGPVRGGWPGLERENTSQTKVRDGDLQRTLRLPCVPCCLKHYREGYGVWFNTEDGTHCVPDEKHRVRSSNAEQRNHVAVNSLSVDGAFNSNVGLRVQHNIVSCEVFVHAYGSIRFGD